MKFAIHLARVGHRIMYLRYYVVCASLCVRVRWYALRTSDQIHSFFSLVVVVVGLNSTRCSLVTVFRVRRPHCVRCGTVYVK